MQYFLYQGNNEIGACDDKHHLIEFRTLGHGLGAEIGAAIAFEIIGEVYIPLTNFTGKTQVLLNAQGTPFDVYRYTAFGEEVITDAFGNAKAPTTAWQFSSKRYDPETGFIYFGKRYYDPQTARWITADPLGYEAGPNLYAYVNNRPLIHIDLYGLIFLNFREKSNEERRIERSVWSGAVHGVIDFVMETFQDIQMPATRIGADGLSLKERKRAIKSVQKSQASQKEILDSKVMETFGVDPSNEIYQATRFYTNLGIEVYCLVSGVYGAAKGLMKGANFKLPKLISKFIDRWPFSTQTHLEKIGLRAAEFSLEATHEIVSGYTYTKSAGKHLNHFVTRGQYVGLLSRPYMRSHLTIQEIMLTGKGSADLTFKGGFNWKAGGTYRGCKGIWELGLNPKTNVIYHFNFVS